MRTLLDRAWWTVYRVTGIYRLDRLINELRARQDEAMAADLERAGLRDSARSMRDLSAWRREW